MIAVEGVQQSGAGLLDVDDPLLGQASQNAVHTPLGASLDQAGDIAPAQRTGRPRKDRENLAVEGRANGCVGAGDVHQTVSSFILS